MRLFRFFKKQKKCIPIVIIGIGYDSHRLAKLLAQANTVSNHFYQVVAFIDENPWNNLSTLEGVSVYYQSDLISLIMKRHVEIVFYLEGEDVVILDVVYQEINKLLLSKKDVKQICLTKKMLSTFSKSNFGIDDFIKSFSG